MQKIFVTCLFYQFIFITILMALRNILRFIEYFFLGITVHHNLDTSTIFSHFWKIIVKMSHLRFYAFYYFFCNTSFCKKISLFFFFWSLRSYFEINYILIVFTQFSLGVLAVYTILINFGTSFSPNVHKPYYQMIVKNIKII